MTMCSPEVELFAAKVRHDMRCRIVPMGRDEEIGASIDVVLKQPGESPIDAEFRKTVKACVHDLNMVERFLKPES